jgi:hypothetical protein
VSPQRLDGKWKSAIYVTDVPIFVVVGVITGYYLGKSINPLSSSTAEYGAAIGAFSFFILSLLPIIRLALQEQRLDKEKSFTEFVKRSQSQIFVKNTLVVDHEKQINKEKTSKDNDNNK